MTESATLNAEYPGATPPGTKVQVLSRSRHSILIRVGKKTVKASPKWLEFDKDVAPPLTRRPLRIGGTLER